MDEGSRTDSLPDAPHAHDATLEAVLRAGIAQKGPALLYAPAVLKSLLEEQRPDARADIALLLVALEEQVPEALLGVYSDEEMRSLTRRLEDQLCERRAIDRRSAGWAVGTWARALRAGPVDVAVPTPAMREGPPAGMSTDPEDAPAWLSDLRPRARTFTRWHAIAGVMAAIVIAAIALYTGSHRARKGLTPAEVVQAAPPLVPAPSVADTTPALPAPAAPIAAAPVVASRPTIPTQPSVITHIAVPTDVTAGRRFSLTIDYRAGAAQPVSIERRSVAGGVGTADAVVVTRIAQLSRPKSGSLRYPFAAIATPARSAFEFTLVDVDGTRSDPRRVVVDVTAAALRNVAVACTRGTCGSVVSSREITSGAKATTRLYETVVRLDDRTTRTARQPNRWKAGVRVRLTAAGRFVAVEKIASKVARRPTSERLRSTRP